MPGKRRERKGSGGAPKSTGDPDAVRLALERGAGFDLKDRAVHNVGVPFTPAHAAAALPFRRWRLVPSAVVVGTLAPDFLYFIRLTPGGRFGHTLLGIFVLTLPLALLVLWMFHRFVKLPVTMVLPDSVQRRLSSPLDGFSFRGKARFFLIAASVLLGIATHVIWDSFTHRNTWIYQHWLALKQPLRLPLVGAVPWYKVLQHGSTVLGIGILAAWFARWYKITPPSSRPIVPQYSPWRKTATIGLLTGIALLGAILRAAVGTGFLAGHLEYRGFVGDAVVTFMALVWWQLVIYGLFSSMGGPSAAEAPHRQSIS